jgi:hypothetical protein
MRIILDCCDALVFTLRAEIADFGGAGAAIFLLPRDVASL